MNILNRKNSLYFYVKQVCTWAHLKYDHYILVSVKFEILTAEHLRVRQLVSRVLEVSLFDIALLQYFGIGLLRKDLFLLI